MPRGTSYQLLVEPNLYVERFGTLLSLLDSAKKSGTLVQEPLQLWGGAVGVV